MDGTHFTEIGGYELGRCVAKGIKDLNNKMTPFLSDDRPVFDPAKPDPIDNLTLQLDPEPTAQRLRAGPGRETSIGIPPTPLFETGDGAIHRIDGKALESGPDRALFR